MPSLERTVKTVLSMVAIMGVGIGLWATITPDEERRKAMAKELPCSSPQQQAELRERNAAVMAMIKEAAETNENVARRPWPWNK